jgi:hypothetical protein
MHSRTHSPARRCAAPHLHRVRAPRPPAPVGCPCTPHTPVRAPATAQCSPSPQMCPCPRKSSRCPPPHQVASACAGSRGGEGQHTERGEVIDALLPLFKRSSRVCWHNYSPQQQQLMMMMIIMMMPRTRLDVAVTTKYRSGRRCCNRLSTASLPTPLGPLMTNTRGSGAGVCL